VRLTTSVPPPGGNGTTIFTGRDGHSSAAAENEASIAAARIKLRM
jgi:hypothetical protein